MKNLLKRIRIDSTDKRDSFIVGAACMGLLAQFTTMALFQAFGILFLMVWLLNIFTTEKSE